jgi:hypothetical protein
LYTFYINNKSFWSFLVHDSGREKLMDFYTISAKTFGSRAKQDYTVAPEFNYITDDLVCKGGSMYAYWYDGLWRTSMTDLIKIIDREVIKHTKEFQEKHSDRDVSMKLMSTHSTSIMESFQKYCKNMPESDVEFNTKILFSDQTPVRDDYSTTQLSYTPISGETPAFDQMFTKLYAPEELEKILWFIGAALTNSMSKIQKFLFLYGGKGSGKGTIIKVFKMLFEGYYAGIDLHKLTGNSEFATAGVRETQLLIDDDSDLSSIKDDTNLLKLTSHEPILVNNKYQSTYTVTFKGLLVAASNQRFKVRNIDSGITRRAVVAEPTDETHDYTTYMTLMDKIEFELPHIAQKAIDLFKEKGPGYYESYVPFDMMESTDLFFSFMREHARALGDLCTLKTAAELYRAYLSDFEYDTSGYKKKVKTEIKRYYRNFVEQKRINGEVVKNVYEGLKWEDIFPGQDKPDFGGESEEDLINHFGLREGESPFDEIAKTYPAQYTNSEGNPKVKWDQVTTTLSGLNTRELHFVRVPTNHIVIDFDLKNEDGEKDLALNLKAAKKFPDTYTELSKSGSGVHLHYIYEGDVEKLASEYDEDIEVKVYKGKASLRRKLSLCNNRDIAHISTGLPEKEEKIEMYEDIKVIHWNEHKLRTGIKGCLDKKYHASTRPNVDFMVKQFADAEAQGVKYDLRDMRQDILAFASSSTNQAPYCLKAVSKIKFHTVDEEDANEIQYKAGQQFYDKKDLWFYDVEVFPNLFILVYKQWGSKEKTTLINPTREQIAAFVERPLVGFNNRRYDNHIVYAALLGEDNLSLYRQSQRIINDKNAGSGMYSGAYELSYTDIYDYLNAGNKMSLKKWEVKLGIKHDEFELPWDQPVPEDMWSRAAEYCGNDVDATEAVFDATQADYNARRILSTLSGLSMNSTTNQHTTAIVFEGKPKRETQKELVYTKLDTIFPGYTYSYGKSEYRGEDPGEGGYVYAEPGVYENVALLDVASMHPASVINLNLFGAYTENFKALMDGRLHCKRDDMNSLMNMFDGKLKTILEDDGITLKDISNGLKTAINSVYGLTSASFDNAFRHPDNLDNIVAKRGALFMLDLKHAVQEKGYTVAHIKTDSIKIPNADQSIIDFVFDFGKQYGYDFEHEDTYRRLALVNKSTYICQDQENVWHATGAQFQDPYVFKTLFTKEPLKKEDFFVTKEVKNASVFLGEKFIGRLAEVYASDSGEEMFRVTEDKKGSIAGTKGYKWKLSKDWSGHKDLNMAYYKDLLEKAVEAIAKVGDINVILDKPTIDKEAAKCEINDYKCIAQSYTGSNEVETVELNVTDDPFDPNNPINDINISDDDLPF